MNDTKTSQRPVHILNLNPVAVAAMAEEWVDQNPDSEETLEDIAADLAAEPLSFLAQLVVGDWILVDAAALPYLSGMATLASIDDSFGCDSGREVVARFLSNSESWQGTMAELVKNELRRRL